MMTVADPALEGTSSGLRRRAFCATPLEMSATSRSLIRHALDRDGRDAREGWVPHGRALGLGRC